MSRTVRQMKEEFEGIRDDWMGQRRRRFGGYFSLRPDLLLASICRLIRRAQLCPKLCPRGPITDPKPPPASQHEKEKPLDK